jgi:hypothetical protein
MRGFDKAQPAALFVIVGSWSLLTLCSSTTFFLSSSARCSKPKRFCV